MDGLLMIDLNEWLAHTWQKQSVDRLYVSSYHTDELLLNDTKKEWNEEAFFLLRTLNHKLQKEYNGDMIVVLAITLSRTRKKGMIVTHLDYSNVFTPPELYLVNKKNDDFFYCIKEKSQELKNDKFRGGRVYYMEKWDHGFDRYLWIYFESK